MEDRHVDYGLLIFPCTNFEFILYPSDVFHLFLSRSLSPSYVLSDAVFSILQSPADTTLAGFSPLIFKKAEA